MAGGDEATADTLASGGSATVASGDPGLPSTGGELPAVDRDRYTIDGEYARGGIGRILKGYDHRLQRKVAIKELIADTPELEARFRREALMTARLQHPAIVPVHDAGQWPGGRSFFAMKHVAGKSLDAVVRATATLEQRLALLPHAIAAIDAIAYAHSEQIIHRDIKPANVLIGDFGETVVIDWGLAKDLSITTSGPDLPVGPYRSTTDSSATVVGAVMGTPSYMPPEQARGEPVDARADVYALGALLYHVLGGVPPFSGPSSDAVLDAVVDGTARPLEEVAPGVAPELAAIVNRAMAREPAARYPSAGELANELRRFQAGKLVAAHRYTAFELIRRWVRKHRGAVAATAVAMIALVAISIYYVRSVVRERGRADAEAERARAQALRTEQTNQDLIKQTDALTLDVARRLLDEDPSATLAELHALSDAGLTGAARLTAADAITRGRSRVFRGAKRRIGQLALSNDGARATTIEEDGTLRLWDLANGTQSVLGTKAHCAAFLPDGRIYEVTSSDVAIHERGTRRVLGPVTFRIDAPITPCVAGSDGSLAVAGAIATVWSPDGHPPRRLETTGDVRTIAVSPDATLVALQTGNQVVLWNPTTGATTRFPAELPFLGTELRFSPSGRWLGMAGDKGKVMRWAMPAARLETLESGTPEVTRVAVHDDGRIAAISSDGDLVLWSADGARKPPLPFRSTGLDVQFGTRLVLVRLQDSLVVIDSQTNARRVLRGHRDWVPAARFLPDDRIISAGSDATLRIWDPREGAPTLLPASSSAVSPDGHTLVVGGPSGVQVIDLATDRHHALPGIGDTSVVAWSTDGAAIAAATVRGEILIWPASGGEPRKATATVYTRGLVASGDGFAAATDEGIAVIARTGEVRRVCASDRHIHFRFSGDGMRAVFGGSNVTGGSVVVDCDIGRGHARELAGIGRVTAVAMSHDGRRFAAGYDNGRIRVWDGSPSPRELAGIDTIHELAFSRDGARLAVSSDDDILRVFELDTSSPVIQLIGHGANAVAMTWSDDGSSLLAADSDLDLREWDVATRSSRKLSVTDSIYDLQYVPSYGFVAASWAPRVYLWRDPVPRTTAGLRGWIDASVRQVGP